MQKIFLFYFFFSLLTVSLRAQNHSASGQTATQHIKTLKEGVLLVKLYTSQNKIDALNSMGRTEWARRIAREQAAENQKLAHAFACHYTFSPVYFFYATDSEKLLQGKYDSLFYDHQLKPVMQTPRFDGNFLVAEFGDIDQNKTSPAKKADQNTSGESAAFNGLVLSDSRLEQLTAPFPYYIRSFRSLGKRLSRSEEKMVQLLNKSLEDFYKERE